SEQVNSDHDIELSPLVEYEISRLINEHDLTESFRQNLLKGRWLRVTEEKSVKLHIGDGERRPDQIVYRNEFKPDLSWLGQKAEPEPEVIQLTEEDDYPQPDLSIFAHDVPAATSWSEYKEMIEDWPLA
ncbi:replication endonuclease, partial [Vibrio anguillarum]|nr:replication endonuclease [Vibrio anguillarum]